MSFPPPEDLARAALATEPLRRALDLAEWISGGAGTSRELTTTGVLRPAVAGEACRALGIELPSGKLRSAKDVEELQRAWEVAVAGDLVLIGGNRVTPALDVPQLIAVAREESGPVEVKPDLAERAVHAWLQGAAVPLGVRAGDPCPQCLTILMELARSGEPQEMAGLAEFIRPDMRGADPGLAGPLVPSPADQALAPDELADLDELVEVASEDAADHAESAVELLLHFGVARTAPGCNPGGTIAITPLGDLLARSIMDAFAPSAEATVSEAVLAVTPLMPDEPTSASRLARFAAQPWVEARGPVGAARELLAFAENAEPAQRFAALEIAQGLGYEAAEAWRELVRKAGFGAYGRQWLARAGEPVPGGENDEAWLLVETLLRGRDGLPDAFLPVIFLSLMQHAGPAGMSAEALLTGIAGCGHPGGPEMARLLSGGRFRAGPLTSPAGIVIRSPSDDADHASGDGPLLQLKVTLRDVSKPPVWRRVLVPDDCTLEDLHDIIQESMGWDDSHLHVFRQGHTHYGVTGGFQALDDVDEDEADVELRDVLARPGAKLTYTYDFGDDWEHEVKLEKVISPDDPAVPEILPAVLAGSGACPPEDCGGTPGYAALKQALADPRHEDHAHYLEWLGVEDAAEFDPAAFDVKEANAAVNGGSDIAAPDL
jgi:hypothetical protein